MRDSNFIKKDEKYIPHFRRTELFTSGGGIPEGKEGEQYSHVRGRTLYFTFEHTSPAGQGRDTPMSGGHTRSKRESGEFAARSIFNN